MTWREQRIRDLHRQMDEMLEHPNGATVGDFAELQRQLSNVLYQQEVEDNLHAQRQCDRERREAVARLVAEP